tara:strand:+ start:116 stop:352 length:237 start_codon:yes stop_codon:yes gene_type:complete
MARRPIPKRKTLKDFKTGVGRTGTKYDTLAFKNYQAARLEKMMGVNAEGMPFYKHGRGMVSPENLRKDRKTKNPMDKK